MRTSGSGGWDWAHRQRRNRCDGSNSDPMSRPPATGPTGLDGPSATFGTTLIALDVDALPRTSRTSSSIRTDDGIVLGLVDDPSLRQVRLAEAAQVARRKLGKSERNLPARRNPRYRVTSCLLSSSPNEVSAVLSTEFSPITRE